MADSPPAKLVHDAPAKSRVVWIIFDEFDQVEAFEDRAPGLALPELDRLAAQSVVASRMERPGPATEISIPALLSGRPVDAVDWRGPAHVKVVWHGQPPSLWPAGDSLFDQLRAAGLNVGIVGWYHPYGRLFGDSVCRAEWYGLECDGFAASMRFQLYNVVEQSIGTEFDTESALPSWLFDLRYREHVDRIHGSVEAALSMVADPKLDVVFLHLPLPHPPYVYSVRRQGFGAPGCDFDRENGCDYDGMLALTDEVLGRLRSAIDRAGLDSTTSLIVTSDHNRRTHPPRTTRVPYVVRLPGQKRRVDVTQPCNALVTRSLIEAMSSGRVTTPEQIRDFLIADRSGPTASRK